MEYKRLDETETLEFLMQYNLSDIHEVLLYYTKLRF